MPTLAEPTRAALFRVFPELKTPRLLLRQAHSADANGLQAAFCDPAVCEYTLDDPDADSCRGAALVEEFAQHFAKRRRIDWVLALRSNNNVIGHIALHSLVFHSRRAGVGCQLASPFWRQGYMTEALRAVLDFAFRHAHLNKVSAETTSGNAAGQALFLRAGFQPEGVLRQQVLAHGQFLDVKLFSLLQSEFEAPSAPP